MGRFKKKQSVKLTANTPATRLEQPRPRKSIIFQPLEVFRVNLRKFSFRGRYIWSGQGKLYFTNREISLIFRDINPLLNSPPSNLSWPFTRSVFTVTFWIAQIWWLISEWRVSPSPNLSRWPSQPVDARVFASCHRDSGKRPRCWGPWIFEKTSLGERFDGDANLLYLKC